MATMPNCRSSISALGAPQHLPSTTSACRVLRWQPAPNVSLVPLHGQHPVLCAGSTKLDQHAHASSSSLHGHHPTGAGRALMTDSPLAAHSRWPHTHACASSRLFQPQCAESTACYADDTRTRQPRPATVCGVASHYAGDTLRVTSKPSTDGDALHY